MGKGRCILEKGAKNLQAHIRHIFMLQHDFQSSKKLTPLSYNSVEMSKCYETVLFTEPIRARKFDPCTKFELARTLSLRR